MARQRRRKDPTALRSYTYEAQAPGETIGHGKGRRRTARSGEVVWLTDADLALYRRIFADRSPGRLVVFKAAKVPPPKA